MKKVIYFLLLLASLSSCKDEESAFQPSIGSEAFSFKATHGGAVMHYTLPADKDIMGLNIRYKDYAGKEILRSASSLCDSMTLVGFNEAKQNIPAEVRLVKRNGDESAPIAINFSTLDSAPYAFIDNVKVLSGWNGFSVQTDNPTDANGIAHIYYLGTDPFSGKEDTVLLSSVNITEGKDTLTFNLKQEKELNTIVIRTEDYRGYMVREKVWNNIASYNTAKLDASKFNFYCDKSIESESECLGEKYLFDGDLKGESYFDEKGKYDIYELSNRYHMYLAGPEAFGTPMYIDMHENKITAQVRMYAMLNISRYLGANGAPNDTHSRLFNFMFYEDKLPCDVSVYAAKDDHGTASDWDSKNWELVATYKQDPDIDYTQRWSIKTFSQNYYRYTLNSKSETEKADSIFMPLNLLCEGQGDGYRYLKIIVNNTYNLSGTDLQQSWSGSTLNVAKYFTMQELEIWTKKED